MAWIDDRVWCHPKLVGLSDRAFRVYIAGLAYSSGFETAGHLSPGQQKTLGSSPKIRGELIANDLWHDSENGVEIHGWDEHNGDRDARRKLERERKRAYRDRKVSGTMSQNVPSDVPSSLARGRGRAPDDGVTGEEVKKEKNSSSVVSSSDPALVVMVADDLAVVLEPEPEAAFQILSAIDKPGYHEPKFTRARFAVVVARHTVADLVGEAEALADWETHGNGAGKDAKDGIQRLRNWLQKAAAPLRAVPDEPDNGGYPRYDPKIHPVYEGDPMFMVTREEADRLILGEKASRPTATPAMNRPGNVTQRTGPQATGRTPEPNAGVA